MLLRDILLHTRLKPVFWKRSSLSKSSSSSGNRAEIASSGSSMTKSWNRIQQLNLCSTERLGWGSRSDFGHFRLSKLINTVNYSITNETFVVDTVNSFRPRQNGRYLADDILKCIFLIDNSWMSVKKMDWSLLMSVQLTLSQIWFGY